MNGYYTKIIGMSREAVIEIIETAISHGSHRIQGVEDYHLSRNCAYGVGNPSFYTHIGVDEDGDTFMINNTSPYQTLADYGETAVELSHVAMLEKIREGING